MGKKGNGKAQKKKLTKKEKKQLNHLKVIQGGKSRGNDIPEANHNNQDKAA